jgi:hypothetical protein
MENYFEQDRYKMFANNCLDKNPNWTTYGMYNLPHQYPHMEYKNNMMEYGPCNNYMQGFCNECNTGNLARGYGFPMHNMMKMEPIENMCGSYKMLIVYVEKTINKIMMENMGMMPKAISKDKYHKEMNEMLCEVMKKEKEE